MIQNESVYVFSSPSVGNRDSAVSTVTALLADDLGIVARSPEKSKIFITLITTPTNALI